jgi:hypothetical protein
MGSRAVVNSYTGANVSIFIGDTLITNAFGITWELSAGKRPIFGYNGLHQQAFATGQVMLLGSLYLNFQAPNYLSYVLKKYFELKRQIFASADQTEAIARLKNSRANLVNEFKQLRPGQTLSPATLNELFTDKAMQTQLIPALTAGELLNVKAGSGVTYNNYKAGLAYDRNLNTEEKTSKFAVYARPDQFVDAEDTKDAIDIVITFGNPGMRGRPGSTATYQAGSGIILRGVNFLGEGMTVMSDDQPVMEVYKFMAVSKDYLVADQLSTEDELELQGMGKANAQEREHARIQRNKMKEQLPGAKMPTRGGGGEDPATTDDPGRIEREDAAEAAAAVRRDVKLPVPDPEGSFPQASLPDLDKAGRPTAPVPPNSAPPSAPPAAPPVKAPGTPPVPKAVEPKPEPAPEIDPAKLPQEGDDG